MIDPSQIAPGEPLAFDDHGVAVVHAVLGAYFQLAPLVPDDEARLEEVNALVLDWFGSALTWSWAAPFAEVEPFEPDHLELVSMHPRSLVNRLAAGPGYSDLEADCAAAAVNKFFVACHGGEHAPSASPWSYRFHCVIPKPTPDPVFRSAASLFLGVPLGWPLEDFRARVLAIAAKLRLRWGAAGLSYGGWEFDRFNATRQGIFAHATRFPGYDVALSAAWEELWSEEMRTVSWLSFIGPELVARIEAAGGRIEASPLVTLEQAGTSTVLVAGARPESGDVNRRLYPDAYRLADAMVRPVRATKTHFLLPWTEASTEAWLRRFERRPA